MNREVLVDVIVGVEFGVIVSFYTDFELVCWAVIGLWVFSRF
jgi:hypothetical protein